MVNKSLPPQFPDDGQYIYKKSVGTSPAARSTHRGPGIAFQSRTSNAEPTPIYKHANTYDDYTP